MRFENKVVMISGAASGFGLRAAERFAAEGARLSLADIDADRLAHVLPGTEAVAVRARVDVSDEADQARWHDDTVAALGGLDIALNNAGAGSPMARLPDTPVAEFDRMMAINARSVFLGMKHQLPIIAAQGGGAILNTASAAGVVGAGHLSAYAASKHAVVGLTRAAADEYARHKVRVNAICPSFAVTPLFDAMADEVAQGRGESRKDAYARIAGRVPMRRVADVDEVVTVMLMLCDPANTFMTGQAISVDGGLTAIDRTRPEGADMTIQAFYAEGQAAHDPQSFMVLGRFANAEEQPERAHRLVAGAEAAGIGFATPPPVPDAALASVHTPEYLRFLATIHARWSAIPDAAPEVIPNVHLDRALGGYPASPVGQAAYHQADAACPIGPGTWEAARWSAASAVAATGAVLAGAPAAYALSRPPGHHAYADLAGGFCFLNNSAIAAQMLRAAHDRVAILDVDVHHGNGTQGIFYARGDVLTVSLHSDPVDYYPFCQGYAHERGTGAGLGYNLNLPLPKTTEDADYLRALEHACAHVAAFAPGALVVALGLDAHEDDPLKGMRLTTRAFEAIGRRIARLGLPSVLVQEGGYLSEALGRNLTAFLEGFLAEKDI